MPRSEYPPGRQGALLDVAVPIEYVAVLIIHKRTNEKFNRFLNNLQPIANKLNDSDTILTLPS